MSQYFGIEHDSDEELQENETDGEEYESDDQTLRQTIDYDLDKMFEIINKRDFNKWSMSTIHTRYRKVRGDDYGRVQIFR